MAKGELYLPEILLSKQYPQVFRLTRPYRVRGSQYLKEGQYITVIDRRKVELIVGVDSEGREFKVRKDRSAYVQALEEERIVYRLRDIIEMAKNIKTIELRKEIRLEKHTFECGEVFVVEKVSKNFRGKLKNIELRRIKDGKIFRFPLDAIGLFKIRTEKTISPLPALLSVRTLPLNVQFQNTPTSSNFPSGVVILQKRFLLNVVCVLTVVEGAYVYETFSADADIFVEKCSLKLPNPIAQINPRGSLACSDDFQLIKKFYKNKVKEIDSKLIEDIYATGYYGSATLEKSALEDRHFVQFTAIKREEMKDVVASNLQNVLSSVSSATEIEYDGRPVPFPRHSKNQRQMINSSNSDIDEQSNPPIQFNKAVTQQTAQNANFVLSKEDIINKRSAFIKQDLSNAEPLRSYITNSCSDHSLVSYASDLSKSTGKVFNRAGSADHLIDRIYQVPNDLKHSRCSSVITVNSGDSGLGLSYMSGDSSQTYYRSKLQETSYNIIDEVRTMPDCEATYENSNRIVWSKNIKRTSQDSDYEDVVNVDDTFLSPVSDEFEISKISKSCIHKNIDNKFESLKSMTQNEVSSVLVRLNLKRFVSRFQRELINGTLLLELDEKILVEDLEFTHFEARKLYNYIHGWRPLIENINSNDSIKSNPAEWSVTDIVNSLHRINLNNLASFCKQNQVDGSLLCDILQEKDIIDSVKNEHGIIFNGLELSRLRAFILKNWRPDDTMKRMDYWGKQNKKNAIWNSFISH